jgi:hypothetical protein
VLIDVAASAVPAGLRGLRPLARRALAAPTLAAVDAIVRALPTPRGSRTRTKTEGVTSGALLREGGMLLRETLPSRHRERRD